jgi:hypothetical protein
MGFTECSSTRNKRAYFRFLLARLRLDHILKVIGKSLRRKQLHTKFPDNAIDAYHQIMRRITSEAVSKKQNLRVLSWIRHSERPLHIDELREVIWVEDNSRKLNRKDVNDFGINAIIRNCESLVTFNKMTGQVKYSHTTVQEFLDSEFTKELTTHTALAITCLTYLNFDVFEDFCIDIESLHERAKNYRFLSYASNYWATHARNADTEDVIWDDMQIAIIETLRQHGKRESMEQMRNYWPSSKSIVSKRKSLLHILVEIRLVPYLPLLSDKLSDIIDS